MANRDMPDQINFLDGANYQLAIARLPMTTFTVQEATLPTVKLGEVKTGNPFIDLNFAATHLDFDRFVVQFKVVENFSNYLELFNWMKGLGFPETHQQYKDLVDNPNSTGGVRSDASLVISTSSHIVHKTIRFRDVFPVSLSDLSFSTTRTGPNYLQATAQFSIRDFEFEDVVE